MSREAPQVAVEQGALRGLGDRGIFEFRGVPYAQPPVGALRWAAPQPPAPWSGVRDATQFGNVAPQAVRMPANYRTAGESEDCLYLNVATESLDRAARKPVMVWIHGGGNLYGAASDPLYDPMALVKRGFVVVSFNYRLGVFGFLAHPLFGANFAVMDYIAALSWVRANIEQFGGDPNNVTIFGHSAGAVATRTLLSCPAAKGLFKRAIIQSAGFEACAIGEWWSPETNTGAAQELFAALGSAHPDGLRSVPTDRVLGAAGAISGMRDRPGLVRTPAQLVWMPVVDNVTIVGSGYPAWTPDVQVMMGTASNEARFFVRPERRADFDHAMLQRMAQALTGPLARDVLDCLEADGLDPYAALDRLVTTLIFTEPAIQTARSFAGLNRDFHVYRFTRTAPGAVRSGFLAAHSVELPYLFGTLDYSVNTPFLYREFARPDWYDATDASVARGVQEAWTSFARDGIAHSQSMQWPYYAADRPQVVEIGDAVSVVPERPSALETLLANARNGQPPRTWLGPPASG